MYNRNGPKIKIAAQRPGITTKIICVCAVIACLLTAAGCFGTQRYGERASVSCLYTSFNARAWNNYRSGNLIESEADFRRVIGMNGPETTKAQNGLAWCLVRTDRFDKAIRLFDNIPPSLERDTGLAYALISRRKTGDLKTALELIKKREKEIIRPNATSMPTSPVITPAAYHALKALIQFWFGNNMQAELQLLEAQKYCLEKDCLAMEFLDIIERYGF